MNFKTGSRIPTSNSDILDEFKL